MSDEPKTPARHAAPETETAPATADGTDRKPRFASGFTSLRDLLSFLAGVAIIGNEVFFQHRVEVAFLTVGVALCGLPVVFGADERRKSP